MPRRQLAHLAATSVGGDQRKSLIAHEQKMFSFHANMNSCGCIKSITICKERGCNSEGQRKHMNWQQAYRRGTHIGCAWHVFKASCHLPMGMHVEDRGAVCVFAARNPDCDSMSSPTCAMCLSCKCCPLQASAANSLCSPTSSITPAPCQLAGRPIPTAAAVGLAPPISAAGRRVRRSGCAPPRCVLSSTMPHAGP